MAIKTLAEQGKRKMNVINELTMGQVKALQELGQMTERIFAIVPSICVVI